MHTHWLVWIYLAVLRLFPAAYRKAYAEELEYAIRAAVTEALARGWPAVAKLAWRELRDLPGALLATHLAAKEVSAMQPNHGKPRWFWYPGWVLVSAGSIPVAGVIAFATVGQIVRVVGGTIVVAGQRHIAEEYLLSWVLIPLLGLLSGCLQYLLLRRYLPRCGWWIAATFLGWALFYVLPVVFNDTARRLSLSPAAKAALLGVMVALPQWWLLRRRVRRAGWWPAASLVGWGLGGLSMGPSVSSALDVVVPALIPALATGVALWLLLDRLPRAGAASATRPAPAGTAGYR